MPHFYKFESEAYLSYSRANGVLDPGGKSGGGAFELVLGPGTCAGAFCAFEDVPAFPDLIIFFRGGILNDSYKFTEAAW